MDVAQMLAHCNVSLETAMGLNFPKRKLIGRLFGKLLKLKFIDSNPMVKNSLTEDHYLTNTNVYNFEDEKTRAINLVRTFYKNGPAKCTTHKHSYFGSLTPVSWVGHFKMEAFWPSLKTIWSMKLVASCYNRFIRLPIAIGTPQTML